MRNKAEEILRRNQEGKEADGRDVHIYIEREGDQVNETGLQLRVPAYDPPAVRPPHMRRSHPRRLGGRETERSDPAPCRCHGGASARISRRTLLADDSLGVRPAHVRSARFPRLVSSRLTPIEARPRPRLRSRTEDLRRRLCSRVTSRLLSHSLAPPSRRHDIRLRDRAQLSVLV